MKTANLNVDGASETEVGEASSHAELIVAKADPAKGKKTASSTPKGDRTTPDHR